MSRRVSDLITRRPRRELVRLFAEQPELLGDVDPAMAAAAARIAVEGAALPRGRLQPSALQSIVPAPLALVVLDGLLAQIVWVGGQRGTALAGPADVLHPWEDERDYAPVPQEESWAVIERVRVAVIDHAFARRLAGNPHFTRELLRRAGRTSRSLAIMRSLVRVRPLHRRALMALWFIGHRWGTSAEDESGTVIPFRIPQGILADLVGAHRQSINEAVRDLREADLARQLDDGRWILHGAPPEELCLVRPISAGILADAPPAAGSPAQNAA